MSLCLVQVTLQCFITNCPLKGRSTRSKRSIRTCPPCGPQNSGQCFGTDLCCGPFGCVFHSSHSAACRRELLDPEPCAPTAAKCGLQNKGFCASDGLCCEADNCVTDESCYEVDKDSVQPSDPQHNEYPTINLENSDFGYDMEKRNEKKIFTRIGRGAGAADKKMDKKLFSRIGRSEKVKKSNNKLFSRVGRPFGIESMGLNNDSLGKKSKASLKKSFELQRKLQYISLNPWIMYYLRNNYSPARRYGKKLKPIKNSLQLFHL